jgi:IS30 family transposase
MGRYLPASDHAIIRQLHRDGVPQIEIAKRFHRAPSSISWIIKHPEARTLEQHRAKKTKGVHWKELEEIDLSCLPDNILFQHSKEGLL